MKKNAVYTVADAVTKWCPKSQVSAGPAGDVHTNTLTNGCVFCAGPNCMAWRWHTTHTHPGNPSGDMIEVADVYGYCGLAGEP